MYTHLPFQSRSGGFSLIELIVSIAILTIITTLAAPSYVSSIERKRAQGLAVAISTEMEFIRAEAAKRNLNVTTTFSATGYTITAINGGTTIPVKSVTFATHYPGTSAVANFGGTLSYTFNPKLGRLTGAIGTVIITNGSSSLRISVNPLGRPSTCGAFGGYPICT